MHIEEILKKLEEIRAQVNSLECRIEALEKIIRKSDINLSIEIPKVIIERKPLDIRINEEELLGRIILLMKEGFFDNKKTASDVTNELIRRCWHPKDLKYVRPALEQLTALGILNRIKEKKQRGKGSKWVYKRGENLEILYNIKNVH